MLKYKAVKRNIVDVLVLTFENDFWWKVIWNLLYKILQIKIVRNDRFNHFLIASQQKYKRNSFQDEHNYHKDLHMLTT